MDRNVINEKPVTDQDGSLSARRAWIEISGRILPLILTIVALRKESVDRNLVVWAVVRVCECRSPQGERG